MRQQQSGRGGSGGGGGGGGRRDDKRRRPPPHHSHPHEHNVPAAHPRPQEPQDHSNMNDVEKFLNDRWRVAEASGVQASKKVVNAWGDNGRKASDLFVKSLLEARNEL